jgi:hypothetical protein
MAFELYATGTYTFRELLRTLSDAGRQRRRHHR